MEQSKTVMTIPIFNTYVDANAESEIGNVLRSTFLSEGEVVGNFEKQLEEKIGVKNCVALNSGTSALHLALVLADVKEGDEVILPAQTFVATGLVIVQQKAKPIFADIDYGTGNISISSIQEKITAKTKAIVPVHWGGYPCDLEEINALAKQYQLKVIEDAAHALGASYKGKPIGSISDYTCFSFQAIKHLTTGDGGAICLQDSDEYEKAITGRWFGINRFKAPMTDLGERSYNLKTLGYKYHMNNYAAALGVANLTNYQERFEKRLKIAEFYKNELNNKVNGITLFSYDSNRQSAFWLFGFHVEKRADFIRMLKERGVTASVVHQRIDRNDIFGGIRKELTNQTKFDETQVHIPIHDGIDLEKASYIMEAIKSGW